MPVPSVPSVFRVLPCVVHVAVVCVVAIELCMWCVWGVGCLCLRLGVGGRGEMVGPCPKEPVLCKTGGTSWQTVRTHMRARVLIVSERV